MTKEYIEEMAEQFAIWENMCKPTEPGGPCYNKHDYAISKRAFLEGANWALNNKEK